MLSVLAGGLLTTVQDQGRSAWQCAGVSAGGAMDRAAARWANRIVGNADTAAVLEITLRGPTLQFTGGCWLALAGSELDAHLDAQPLPVGSLAWAPAGSRLTLGAVRGGCRSYLALAGGLDVPVVLGSRSTALRAGFGGWGGRPLQKGDALPVGVPSLPAPRAAARVQVSSWRVDPAIRWARSFAALRLVASDELPPDCLAALQAREFTVSPQSDRMGLRLAGAALAPPAQDLRLSAGLAFGSVQLPPDGRPIILGADRQPTGGYALLGTVATVDHGKLAQLCPGARVAFARLTLEEARAALYREQAQEARAQLMLAHRHRQLF
jgi:antagonist of KipI